MKNKKNRIELTISIVSMNNIRDLKICIESIYKYSKNINLEIIIVAYFYSSENLNILRSLYPSISIIRSNKIRGYFENHNLALKKAQGKYCAILNDDIELLDNAFYHSINYMKKNSDCAATCPVLLNKDGSVQVAWRKRFTPVRLMLSQFGHFGRRISGLSPKINMEKIIKLRESSIEIPYGSGAFITLKKSILKKINYLDESFFLGPDDVWLGYQLEQEGLKIYLLPKVQVIHSWGGVLGKTYPITLPPQILDNIRLIKKISSSRLNHILKPFMYLNSALILLLRAIIYLIKKDVRSKLLVKARWNLLKYGLSFKNGKQYFIKLISKEKSIKNELFGHWQG